MPSQQSEDQATENEGVPIAQIVIPSAKKVEILSNTKNQRSATNDLNKSYKKQPSISNNMSQNFSSNLAKMPMSHQKLPSRVSERAQFISAQKATDNSVVQRRLSTNHLGP